MTTEEYRQTERMLAYYTHERAQILERRSAVEDELKKCNAQIKELGRQLWEANEQKRAERRAALEKQQDERRAEFERLIHSRPAQDDKREALERMMRGNYNTYGGEEI